MTELLMDTESCAPTRPSPTASEQTDGIGVQWLCPMPEVLATTAIKRGITPGLFPLLQRSVK